MSQATFIVPDSDGTTFLANVNAALAAIQTGNVGTVDPSYKVAGMGWWRSDVPGAGVWTYYLYDGTTKTAFLTFDTGTHALGLASAVMDGLLGSTKGMLAKRTASVWAGLAVGSAFHGLHVNAAGDDLEYRRNGWEKIADDAVPSSAASVDFTGIPANVKQIKLLYELVPATNAVALCVRLSQSASFVTSSSYPQTWLFAPSAGGISNSSNTLTAFQPAGTVYAPSGGTYPGIGGQLLGLNLQAADKFRMIGHAYGQYTGDSFHYSIISGLQFGVAGAIDGIQLFFSSGNIASGRVSLLGLRA